MKEISRRGFLAQSCKGVSAAWLATHWTEIRAAAQHAHHAVQTTAPARFEFFTPEQAREIEAATAQIIPSDDSPGAREAHVVYFIDRVLTTIEADKQPLYKQGLALLASRARRAGGARFSELEAAQQIAVLKKIDKTPFFQLLRSHTIAGFFANPEYGGNYNQAGWKLIGFEDQFAFAPPFGFYDRDYKPEQ